MDEKAIALLNFASNQVVGANQGTSSAAINFKRPKAAAEAALPHTVARRGG